MPSETPSEAYVWVWLPGQTTPVVAGRVFKSGVGDGAVHQFIYGQSYLERGNAVALFDTELPLKRGPIAPLPGLTLAGCLRDGAPDAWGRRVILNRLATAGSTSELDELTCFLASGSDRAGALDFQTSATTYTPRLAEGGTLDDLLAAADLVDQGTPLPADLDLALRHGTSLGGARPKAILDDDGRKLIAKFSSSTDLHSVVKAEFVAMRLAAHCGLNVANVELARALDKDVLLVERFDRVAVAGGWQRRGMVSALTLLGLDEMMARYASYEDLAEIVRLRFDRPSETLRELFGRLIFNILCGNTDDHARNHAAFWDGVRLTLTPAYDLCPQNRTGNVAGQAMRILGQAHQSQLQLCLQAAPVYLLSSSAAEDLIVGQVETIRRRFDAVCDEARMTETDRRLLGTRQFLNPFAFEGAPERVRHAAGL
jgi:serine/threonine-protein kinase HipA